MSKPFKPGKKSSKSSQEKNGLAKEVAVVADKISGQLTEIVERHVSERIKVLMNQLKQVRERLSVAKLRLKTEVDALKTEKQMAVATLCQTKQRLATVEQERDALIKRLKGK